MLIELILKKIGKKELNKLLLLFTCFVYMHASYYIAHTRI